MNHLATIRFLTDRHAGSSMIDKKFVWMQKILEV